MVCSHLSPTDLATLAGMSKDYYMSVQEPLFCRINVNSFKQLVKLVGTLTKPPVVSQISARQRLRWQSLTDAQLREREMKHLNLTLDFQIQDTVTTSKPISGELLSRCIGAISRCRSGVRIHLTFHGSRYGLLQQLQSASLTDVRELKLYLGGNAQYYNFARAAGSSSPPLSLWELCFSGTAFPDLQIIEFDTHHSSCNELPDTVEKSARLDYSEDGSGGYGSKPKFTPFYGLKKMKRIKLQYNNLLDGRLLRSLFGSNIIPQNLTHLEIANCPSLRQTDLAPLSMCAQRSTLDRHTNSRLQVYSSSAVYSSYSTSNSICSLYLVATSNRSR